MITPQQLLYRRAAIAGFIFGINAVVALLMLFLIGLTAEYIQQMQAGTAPLLMPETDPIRKAVNSLCLFYIAPIAYAAPVVFWVFAAEAVIRPEQVWLSRIGQLFISGIFAYTLVLGAFFQHVFLKNTDPNQLPMLGQLILSAHFIYNMLHPCVLLIIALGGYFSQTLPKWVCGLLICVNMGLILFEYITLSPDIYAAKIILGIFIGTTRDVLLAIYFWIASQPLASYDHEKTVEL